MPTPAPSLITRQPSSGTRGFALLITIVLLAFLVLLLVSLASLTRVETQVAANSQQLSQARQNALMALNIALGELQRTTGPDQRATARADLGEGAPAFRYNASDKLPLVAPRDGTRYWTSAWGQQDDPANPGWQQNAVLLNWLVSGNERTTFTADTTATTSYHDGGTSGLITTPPATAPAFGPDSAVTVTGSLQTLTATQTAGEVKIAGRDAALLVGPATVGKDAAGNPNTAAFVLAPLVDIEADNSTIPGLGSGGTTKIGRYAYWVGDEGVKARANLVDPWATPTNAAEAQAAFSTAQRFAIERMATAPVPTADVWDTLYPKNEEQLKRVLNIGQLPLASPVPATATEATAARYHDLTTHSFSVLADQRSGGLKRELDRELVNPSASSPADTDSLFRREATDTTTGIGLQSYRVPPTWGRLRNWYGTLRTSPGGVITPQFLDVGGSATVPISPVILWAELGFGAFYEKDIPAQPAPNFRATLNIYPKVALWNPYNHPMAGRLYEIGLGMIKTTSGSDLSFVVRDATKLTGPNPSTDSLINVIEPAPPPPAPPSPKYEWRMSNGVLNNSDSLIQYITFVIDCPRLEPGQTLWFSLAASSDYNGVNILTAGDRVNRVSVPGPVVNRLPPQVDDPADPLGPKLDALVWGHRYRPWGGDAEIYLREDGLPPVLTGTFPTKGTLAPAANHRFFQYVYGLNLGGAGAFSGQLQNPTTQFNTTYNSLGEGTGSPSSQVQFIATWSGMRLTGFSDYVRWVANANPRATLSGHTGAGNDTGGAFQNNAGVFLGDKNANYQFNFSNDIIGPKNIPNPLPFPVSGELSTGVRDYAAISGVANRTTLFDLPAPTTIFTSIAQLQQAPLSDFSVHPAYAIGNSLAEPRLPRGVSFQQASAGGGSTTASGLANFRSIMHGSYHHYDLSYRLNASLLDRYFFSSLYAASSSPVVTTFPAPNSRMVPYPATIVADDPDFNDPAKAATKLLLTGGFNINSASEQAWLALLSARQGVRYNPRTGNATSPPSADWTPISRLQRPLGDNRDTTKGYRYLTGDTLDGQVTGARGNQQLAVLAKAIVAEVKARGPFTSVSQFVNRELTPAPTPNVTGSPLRQDNSLKGALQAALDRDTRTLGTTNNINVNRNASLTTAEYRFTESNRHMAGTPGNTATDPGGEAISFGVGESGNNGESLRGLVGSAASLGTANNTSLQNPIMSKNAFLPGFITQADMLAALGPMLSARSDTFTVRTYGEAINPVTSESTGRAWLEAVVQRLPEYVDLTDPSLTGSPALGAATPPTSVNDQNRQFGRRYNIISLRWLSPSDI
jgi:hypothetical protein